MSKQMVGVLVFADPILPGFSVQSHGGPVGSGLGVELLCWGDWWNSPRGERPTRTHRNSRPNAPQH